MADPTQAPPEESPPTEVASSGAPTEPPSPATTPPQVLTPPPSLADVSQEKLEAALAAANEYLKKHVDELDYRNFDIYLLRANAAFALGRPAVAVSDDLFLAARCLKDRADLHLSKYAPERFISRRVLPVELGLISGQPELTQELGENFGMPFSMLLAGEVSYGFLKETDLLTAFFRRGMCPTHRDLGGLGAIAYSGALAAVCRGFDDEAKFVLGMFNDVTRSMLDKPAPDAVKPMLLRYDGLCLALSALLTQQFDALAQIIGQIVAQYEADQRRKLADKWTQADPNTRYLDTAVVALLAAAALRQVALELPPAAAHYQGLVTVFTTQPAREEDEKPEMSAADRRLLRDMGIDPDQMEARLRAQAEEAGSALQEAGLTAAITAATAGAVSSEDPSATPPSESAPSESASSGESPARPEASEPQP